MTPTDQHRDEAHVLLNGKCLDIDGRRVFRHSDECNAITDALAHRDAAARAEGRAEGLMLAMEAVEGERLQDGLKTEGDVAYERALDDVTEALRAQLGAALAASPSAGQVGPKDAGSLPASQIPPQSGDESDDWLAPDDLPDCTAGNHQPYCRKYKPPASALGEVEGKESKAPSDLSRAELPTDAPRGAKP